MAQAIGLGIYNEMGRGMARVSEVLGDIAGISKVLMVAESTLDLIDTKFTLFVDNYEARSERILPRLKRSMERLHIWQERKKAFDAGGDIDEKIRNRWRKFKEFHAAKETDLKTAKAYLDYKIIKWEAELKICKFENRKSLFAYASEGSKALVIALKLCGLVETSAVLLGLGLLVVLISLGKKVHKIAYKNLRKPKEPAHVVHFRTSL